jgi:hypothetical protein
VVVTDQRVPNDEGVNNYIFIHIYIHTYIHIGSRRHMRREGFRYIRVAQFDSHIYIYVYTYIHSYVNIV